jgi:hypothetical protein
MAYEFPDEATLVKYLAMLREVLVEARFLSYEPNPRVAELLDAVENVPDLLARWPDMEEGIVVGQLEDYERKYLGGAGRFTKILRDGPRSNWQLRWKRNESVVGRGSARHDCDEVASRFARVGFETSGRIAQDVYLWGVL